MSFSAPRSPEPDPDERELLLGFIRWHREQVVATADGLDDKQIRWRPDGKLLSIGGIINHLTHMEWRWIEGRYLGSGFPARTDEFNPDDSVTLTGLLDAYWDRGQRTDAIARAGDLDGECLGDEGGRGPAHVLLGYSRPVTLRWALLHVLDETAHHAGHADATREMLDGAKMRA